MEKIITLKFPIGEIQSQTKTHTQAEKHTKNLQGLKTKQKEILAAINMLKSDIVVLIETK